jgi:hypothetical protein
METADSAQTVEQAAAKLEAHWGSVEFYYDGTATVMLRPPTPTEQQVNPEAVIMFQVGASADEWEHDDGMDNILWLPPTPHTDMIAAYHQYVAHISELAYEHMMENYLLSTVLKKHGHAPNPGIEPGPTPPGLGDRMGG